MRALRIAGTVLCLKFLALGQPVQKLEFEVASIKPIEQPKSGQLIVRGPGAGGPGTDDPEHIVWNPVSIRYILLSVLNIKPYQMTGPEQLDNLYDFSVKVPAGATKDDVRAMWITLFERRFGMKLHHASKEFPVDELVAGKDPPKLKPASTNLEPQAANGGPNVVNGELRSAGLITFFRSGPTGVNASVIGRAQTLSALADVLAARLGHPVVDKTGLTGKYDFQFDYIPEASTLPPAPPPPPGAGPVPPAAALAQALDPGQSIAIAMQQQLGLRLTKGKANLDTVIVDVLNNAPTEN